MSPKVSVLMPVYNAEEYLREAIESILSQSFADYEFLIFNDGSSDRSADIISSYSDKRIRFFNSEKNYGYVKHLNDGLALARGKFIARMDADDIALPQRFEKQLLILESDEKIGLCGSWMKIIGSEEVIQYPESSTDITNRLLIENPFAHSAVMFRKNILTENNLSYDQSYMPAEDFKLWSEIGYYSDYYNIPEILIHYRRHPGQISKTKQELQMTNVQRVRIESLTNNFAGLSPEEITLLKRIDYADKISGPFDFKTLNNVLLKIMHNPFISNRYDKYALKERLLYLFKVNVYSNKALTISDIVRGTFFSELSLREKFSLLIKFIEYR